MIPWLHPLRLDFPPLETALEEPNGLLAAGGDLRPARIIAAYRHGVFPWFNDDEPILWWSPDPRCVLIPSELHISRSLRKALRKTDYRVSFDTAFTQVIEACASPRSYSAGTWISPAMQRAYIELFNLGYAHSVEMWADEQLVGGLYGLAIGGVFFGESMFSWQTNASKIAFAHLVEHLKNWGYALIDCQVYNDHLASLGAREIPRVEFIERLSSLLELHPKHEWQAAPCFQNEGPAS